jgi:hypothetical protein
MTSIYKAAKARFEIITGWDEVPRPEPVHGPYEPRHAPMAWSATPQFQAPVIIVDRGLSVGVAYVLWLLLGLIGAHYFYMGKIGVGVLYLLTGGLLGVGWFIDLFTLKGQVERLNRRGW